jgi:hypothetical protein
LYTITAAAFAPAVSIIAFQNTLTVGTESGIVMRWNSNVAMQSLSHNSKDKIYGTLYGKSLTQYDQPFPDGVDPALISKPPNMAKYYPEIQANPNRGTQ